MFGDRRDHLVELRRDERGIVPALEVVGDEAGGLELVVFFLAETDRRRDEAIAERLRHVRDHQA